ncbi:hypothetical protein BHE74_00046954, partial [Ensete ventricosum]
MQIAEDYSHCEFLLRLPGYCPMPAFRDVIDVPLVVRSLRRSRSEVRKELGIGDDVKVVIYNFGGQVVARILQDTATGKHYVSNKSLSGLDSITDSKNPEKRQMRERIAAVALFDWEETEMMCKVCYTGLCQRIEFIPV